MNVIKSFIRKYRGMQVQARASIWYTICNVLQKGISFIVIPIYIRVLTTEEYGVYTVFQSWRDILIIFATLNLYAGVFTKAMVDFEDDRDVYTSSMQGLSTLVTGAMFIVYICASPTWNRLLDLDLVTMLLLFLYFVFYPALTFWTVRKRVENDYRKMVVVTLLVSVLTPAVSLMLFYGTSLRERAVVWGYLVVQSLFGGYFYVRQFLAGRTFYHRDYWVKALRFNIPLIPHYLSLIILGQADRIMIKEYCGKSDAAIYGLAHQLATVMSIVTNAVNSSFVPWVYDRFKRKRFGDIGGISTKLCVFVAAMTLGLTIVAPEIIRIVGTDEYQAAVWAIPPVALSVYYTFCYGLFCDIEFYYGETHYVMLASVIGAALNIVLNAIFIPRFGFLAAGYTTMVCYFIFMLMHYLFMRRVCRKMDIPLNVFNVPAIAVLTAAITGICLLCIQVYPLMWLRYAVVLVMAAVVIVKRRTIIELLRRNK